MEFSDSSRVGVIYPAPQLWYVSKLQRKRGGVPCSSRNLSTFEDANNREEILGSKRGGDSSAYLDISVHESLREA